MDATGDEVLWLSMVSFCSSSLESDEVVILNFGFKVEPWGGLEGGMYGSEELC